MSDYQREDVAINEADYKRRLVAEINVLQGGYARRIEDRWATGVLDMILKLPRRPIVFAEGKLVRGNIFGPTERQYHEGVRIAGAGLVPLLIGWKGREMAVAAWAQEADWRECYVGPNKLATLMERLDEHA